MHAQLWPLYIIAAFFGLYTLKAIVAYYWHESLPTETLDIEDLIQNITPTDTPFMRRIRQDAQYRKETNEGKDNA